MLLTETVCSATMITHTGLQGPHPDYFVTLSQPLQPPSILRISAFLSLARRKECAATGSGTLNANTKPLEQALRQALHLRTKSPPRFTHISGVIAAVISTASMHTSSQHLSNVVVGATSSPGAQRIFVSDREVGESGCAKSTRIRSHDVKM